MQLRATQMAAAIAAVVLCAEAGSALAHPVRRVQRGGPLSGTWHGYLTSQTAHGTRRTHMTLTINARETAGNWRVGRACYGRLTLEDISGGYHHYLRHVAPGLNCATGDVDCLKRAGAELYDAVTTHGSTSWNVAGTLKRLLTGTR